MPRHCHARIEAHFSHNALFIGPNVRDAVQAGRRLHPVFPFRDAGAFAVAEPPLDVALIHITPPGAGGFCSLGTSVDCTLSAALNARPVIAQVDASLPCTGGHRLHISEVDVVYEAQTALREYHTAEPGADTLEIGRHIAGLIEDGSTLQLGIGSVPDAVLRQLGHHRDLGIHTEMFSDGVIDLVERGVITGARKAVNAGIIVSSFVIGTSRLYRFVDQNPGVELRPADYTNDPTVIASHEKMVAINSALSVDLTGQVVADSLGPRFYSGIGGQVRFHPRGRSFAPRQADRLPAINRRTGASAAICAEVCDGSESSRRADVHWVVTEYGARNLHD